MYASHHCLLILVIVFSLDFIPGEDGEEEHLYLKKLFSKSFETPIQQITCSKTDDVACIGFHHSCDLIDASSLKSCQYDSQSYVMEEDEEISSFLPLKGKNSL